MPSTMALLTLALASLSTSKYFNITPRHALHRQRFAGSGALTDGVDCDEDDGPDEEEAVGVVVGAAEPVVRHQKPQPVPQVLPPAPPQHRHFPAHTPLSTHACTHSGCGSAEQRRGTWQ
eukprot:1962072-Rhodomonas_salina.2